LGTCGKASWVGVNLDRVDGITVDGCYGDPDNWVGGPDPTKIDQDRGGFHSHGTRVAGLINAATNNTTGVAGLAPHILVLPIRMEKVYSEENERWYFEASSKYKAVKALFDYFKTGFWEEDIRVVNMSFGSASYNSDWRNLIADDQRRYNRLYIGSAGNNASNLLYYPAAYDVVLGVSGLWRDVELDEWYSYITRDEALVGSNYRNDGYQTYPVSGIIGFTPYLRDEDTGVGRSLSPSGDKSRWGYGGLYDHFSGTSACAPQVSALAALLLTKNPFPGDEQVRDHIISTRDTSMEQEQEFQIAGILDFDRAYSTW